MQEDSQQTQGNGSAESTVGASKQQTEDVPVDEDAYEEAHSYSDEVESIQEAISQAMAGGELPFVLSSAIHENPVRITVTVNTTDETLIEQVKAFDPSGEIIEIVYSDTAAAYE